MNVPQRQMTWDEVVAQMVEYRNERDALRAKVERLKVRCNELYGMSKLDPEPVGWNPNTASRMTPERARYFMERFKKEEKLLGPNEQAAVDYVLTMLESAIEKVINAGDTKLITATERFAMVAMRLREASAREISDGDYVEPAIHAIESLIQLNDRRLQIERGLIESLDRKDREIEQAKIENNNLAELVSNQEVIDRELFAIEQERDALRAEVEAVRKANIDCVLHYEDAVGEVRRHREVIQQALEALEHCCFSDPSTVTDKDVAADAIKALTKALQ